MKLPIKRGIRSIGVLVLIGGIALAAGMPSAGEIAKVRAQTACSSTTTSGPPSPGGGVQVCYVAGWNLVGGPDGFAVPVPIWVWDAVAGQYKQYPANTQFGPAGIGTGQGAWAYFGQSTSVTIPGPPSSAPVSIALKAGQWQQIGNPFHVASATVCGAGAAVQVFTYSPAAGSYSQSTTLGQGQGAWVYSSSNTTLVLSPSGVPGAGCPAS